MPSIVRSYKWFIRITAPWEHIRSKLPEIKEWIDYESMMIGFHIGTKNKAPHAHFCISLKSELQKQSVDNRFRKLFDVKGSLFSSKPWDGSIKAMSYLYHDPKGEVVNEMKLTEEELNEIKELNHEIQKVVEVNKGRASHKVVEYVLNEIGENQWTRYEIGECILRAVARGQFYDPGDFQLERYINEIELKQVKDNPNQLDMVIGQRLSRLSSFRK